MDEDRLSNRPALSNGPSLTRSSLGHVPPQAFLLTAGTLLGDGLVANWPCPMGQENYTGATALLVVH